MTTSTHPLSHSPPKILSPRETQLLHLVAAENTNIEIASQLYIAVSTVETHRRNILTKLGVKNTAGMIRKAFELGILAV